jgi:gliding motility-associated-like protein/uncharacterized repeat protein (TIGR01451 family)
LICEKAKPNNCDPATVTVTVTAPAIIAQDDSIVGVNGATGTMNAGNVFNDNGNGTDTLNGIAVVIGQVNLTVTTPAASIGGAPVPVVDTATGNVSVPAGTAEGTYIIVYSICEKANPSNCDSATVTVTVTNERPSIALVKTAIAVDENGDGFATVGETIRYNFTVSNTGNVPLTNITITDDLPGLVLSGGPITLSVGQQDSTSFVGVYKITKEDENVGQVANQATVYGTSPLGVIVKDLSDNFSESDDGYTILSIKKCVVEVSNALTPNGDGRNEYFHIEGLECFSNNTVEIYNRWGVLVFETSRYNNVDNVFNGYSRGRTTIKQSESLPDGTYYYVLKYVDFSGNGVQKAGYLYLSR